MRGTKVVLWRQNDFNSLNNAVFFEGRAGQECPGYLFVPRVIPVRPPPTAFRSPPLSMSFSAAPSKTTCNHPCESLSMKQPPRTIRIPCHGSTWTGMDQSKIPAPASAHSLSHFPVTPEIPPPKKPRDYPCHSAAKKSRTIPTTMRPTRKENGISGLDYTTENRTLTTDN